MKGARQRSGSCGESFMARAWNELLEQAGLRIAWEEAEWCSSALDSLEATITVSDR